MHVTAKPSSFQCNLKCDYCFYLEKESQFTHEKWMDDSTLKEFIKQYIAASGNQVYFTWQGGEPTLAGLDFFRKVIHYQQRYAGQKRIFNALQTNGILLNNEWCAFLKEHEFLVGISIDGPQELHDCYRRSNSGNGTFAKVIAAIERLKSYQIEFNTLTVINNINVHYPLEVYHFLKSIGSKHMQFIELLETGTPNIDFSGHSENTFRIIDFSVPPTAYGKFMSTIFMQWVKNDVGEIFIRQFESFVSRFLGNGHTSCIFQESCKDNLVVESNGDIYECDHFVYPQYKIGNINKNAVDQQAERDLRMLTSRLASSSLNNTPFLSPEETYQLSKRLWQQITVQSLAEKWQQLRKNQDAFWEQMVNNEVAAKKALSPAAILALEKEYANKKLAAYIFPGRNLSLTVDADPQAEISSKETLAENLTSLTLSNGARVILAKSAGEEQKLQITAVSNKGDLSFPAQQKSLIALANKAVSGSGVGELSSSSLKRWSAENSVTMSSKVSGMNTLLSVSARTNNPEPGFQLINQRINHSTINDNIWASLQNAQIQALKTLDQRPAEKFAQQMYETRYADGRTKLPQENQIAQFTAADALAADRQLFSSPADITFVIVGNVAEDKLVALITRYLGSIKHSDSPLAAGKPLTRATDNASVTVKEQNEPVAQVSQWKRYNSRTPVNLATRMALDAFNVALAKDLRINIREQASGAYSVSSRLSVDPQAKDISHLLAFTCQPERHDELLTLANEVMVKRLAKGISEQELNEYQQNVQRSLDIQQRSVQQLANTIVNSLIQYDDPAAWTEQEQLLKQMTVENVNTAVKQYLSHPVNTYTGVLLPK